LTNREGERGGVVHQKIDRLKLKGERYWTTSTGKMRKNGRKRQSDKRRKEKKKLKGRTSVLREKGKSCETD